MNAPFASPDQPRISKLKAWRKRQLAPDPSGAVRRTLRITDIPGLYGIPISSWNGWEQLPGDPSFRRPDEANMRRLFEITGGEIRPEDFYPIAEWQGAQPEVVSD